MSERHVVLRAGRGDTYMPRGAPRSTVVFSLHGYGDDPKSEIKEKHLWSRVQRHAEVGLRDVGIEPPQTALDLYRISAAAYCADLRLVRQENGYDDWTRQIVLHVPVADRELWLLETDTVSELLGYLSGDRWSIELRQAEVPAPSPKRRRRSKGEDEANLSPSMRSACSPAGWTRSLVRPTSSRTAATSYCEPPPRGGLAVGRAGAGGLRDGLAKKYEDQRIEHVKVTLNPPRPSENTGKEDTQRARSILFFGLGILAAAGSAMARRWSCRRTAE